MARWMVLAVPLSGLADSNRDAQVVAEFDGTEEEAGAMLWEAANTYEHRLWKVRRREVFRVTDRSYFIRIHGRMAAYGILIQLAEKIYDSAAKTSDPTDTPYGQPEDRNPWA
ncbi:hypothetical protein ABT160_13975 [Streptomyces sp. NPDC001941]|uniref:hypothetical protein n=1 Tax=Streptomyces sp. NPDC001941 TaxID=3154659 RepID=UPI0033322D8A